LLHILCNSTVCINRFCSSGQQKKFTFYSFWVKNVDHFSLFLLIFLFFFDNSRGVLIIQRPVYHWVNGILVTKELLKIQVEALICKVKGRKELKCKKELFLLNNINSDVLCRILLINWINGSYAEYSWKTKAAQEMG
jgi:hypothetical protein